METKTFEENLKRLEEVVRSLENKDISLEEAVKNYTIGLELSKKCYDGVCPCVICFLYQMFI